MQTHTQWPAPSRAALQVSDGAAATLMMTRREANRRGLPILGIFRSFAAVGVDPAIMGVGPAVAIPEAVKQAGLQVEDIDLFELNEAFASQVRQPRTLVSLLSRQHNVWLRHLSIVMATHQHFSPPPSTVVVKMLSTASQGA